MEAWKMTGDLYEDVKIVHEAICSLHSMVGTLEDELPKIEEANCEWVGSEDVLALLWNGDMSVGRYERDNISGEYYWTLYNVDKDHQVTHWMHLPQPPKKGD